MDPSAGEQLKKFRLEKGLSLEQLSAQTHIRLSFLEALESDQREYLPSEVQARGFIRLIAGVLGVDPDPIIVLWGGKPPEPAPAAEVPQPQLEPKQNLKKLTNELDHFRSKFIKNKPEPVESISEDTSQFNPPVENAPEIEAVQLPEPPFEEHPSISESQKIFNQIGADLRRQRELLGLKPADIEKYTMVRGFYLDALEEGRFDDLPSPVQGRGMLKNVASFLELDSDAILLRFAEGLQIRQREKFGNLGSQPVKTAHRKSSNRFRITLRQWVTPDLVITSGIIVVLLVFVIWSASQISASRRNTVVPTVPGISNVLAITPTTFNATPSVTPTPDFNALPEDQTQPLAAEGAAGETPTELPTSSAPLQIYLVARLRTYVQIISDGKVIFNGRLTPGNAYPFDGQKRLELLTGNAAGVQVFFNQNDLGTLGGVGQVVNLVFSLDGVQTPTPSASTTPTATRQPTQTAQPSPTLPTPTVTPFIP